MPHKKHDGKHLNISQRIIIEKGLCDNDSFLAIAQRIGKAPSTVSKEIRRQALYLINTKIYHANIQNLVALKICVILLALRSAVCAESLF